ncbi:hypothetical protein BC354_16125 [Vibrio cholerae]|nr:hypothetical protein BC354_16125 [Vibrio cholerae]RGP93725.1 hypothetical protein BC352_15535 [Vibrio cholerae]
MVTGCPSEIRKSLYGSGGACWKTHYRQKLTVGTWAVMAVIYYIAMISHQGLIRIFLRYYKQKPNWCRFHPAT